MGAQTEIFLSSDNGFPLVSLSIIFRSTAILDGDFLHVLQHAIHGENILFYMGFPLENKNLSEVCRAH